MKNAVSYARVSYRRAADQSKRATLTLAAAKKSRDSQRIAKATARAERASEALRVAAEKRAAAEQRIAALRVSSPTKPESPPRSPPTFDLTTRCGCIGNYKFVTE